MNRTILALVILFTLLLACPVAAAGPRVIVVVGPEAPPLERRAADELVDLLRRLFDADVTVTRQAPDGAGPLILLGRPESNPAVKAVAGERWPKLGEQGHVVRSVTRDSRTVVLVGGGSPVATLWAVHELGHHFGVRSLLGGDVLPARKPEWKPEGIDIVREATLPRRTWLATLNGPLGPEAWPAEEQNRFLTQLARVKFSHVSLNLVDEGPATALLGQRYAVDGDTPGRMAFRGAAVFANPYYAGMADAATRAQAAEKLAGQLRAAAAERGLTASPALGRSAVPPEPSLLPRVGLERLHGDLVRLRRQNGIGLAIPFGVVGDRDAAMYYLSRAAFDATVTPKRALDDLFTAMCGEGVAERVTKGLAQVEEAERLIDRHDLGFAAPAADVVLKHYNDKPTPEWWKTARELYSAAMDEMYRGNTRAREGTRSFTLYHAKRLEFAVHYMSSVEALRLAGQARAKKDAAKQVEQLEKAVEAMHNALSAYGEVARDSSDRRVIALLNEYGYRPLQVELEAAEKAARK